ncbi:hypothetical protein TanjilG_23733 [Lupinus angustifolius]|uniref:RNA helicase n=1 Tax=Lupinus angustifolius TaxID=3871 RepID=A0A1J7G4L6_LUPAN|nr:hypothetical protein TanjilG_23733 [Lupinus angustifolius]
MAPKKKKNQNQKAKPPQSSSSSGPKLQISAENENRLRRLLLNSATTTPASDEESTNLTLTKAQKAKKLKSVYEKLSCEGFSNHHIELALSALNLKATFESALDWLCLNIPGNELPLIFSTGFHSSTQGGSVGVISNQPTHNSPTTTTTTNKEELDDEEEKSVGFLVLIKKQHCNVDDTFDSSQADWIRQYVEQNEEEEEEDEYKTWEDDDTIVTNRACEPRSYDVIAKEYLAARLGATKAKEKGDKKGQEQAGSIIRKLKQELSAIGLSDAHLALQHGHEIGSSSASEGASTSHEPFDCSKEESPCDAEGYLANVLPSDGTTIDRSDIEHHSIEDNFAKSNLPVLDVEKDSAEGEAVDIELGDFFLEGVPSNETLPPDILQVQMQEKTKRLYEKNLDKLEGIWKKGDPQKIPKAVLHQLCQKSGWEAPKYHKILDRGKSFSYSVSILRKASGRGKNRKAGGLVTLNLPDQNETFESAEDAQNRVAAYALFQLFPDIPVHFPISEPYALLVKKWMEGESLTKLDDSEEDHRSGFVDSLLNGDGSGVTASVEFSDYRLPHNFGGHSEKKHSTLANHQPFPSRETYSKEMESTCLRQVQNNKMRTQRYQDMLKIRARLPIAALKGNILQLLKEYDALVVCGETGSGKTTQDAQNRVAAYALFQLFPDIPVHFPISEPYALLVKKWMEGESLTKLDDSEEDHRSGFVDSLLNGDGSGVTASVEFSDYRLPHNFGGHSEKKHSTLANHQPFPSRETYSKEMESTCLRQVQNNKMRTQRYQDMLKIRARLPIAALKGNILQLLKEYDALVVCGETGSGKTTQAISVAERVADERCEPSPGSDGSVIGYQVRLDSARNEKTRLLFCTTGILLRKLMGNQSLTGITHIIVDEVHERSLLGDFLLIVLKNLIEKQSFESCTKLKVIVIFMMFRSATVDSTLFSRYFGHCPVVTAEGRTHPVTTHFLEDIYDKINYRLASDSPASLSNDTFPKEQNLQRGTVTNSRGKKSLALSAWGDEFMLSEENINPHFVTSYYQSYSEQAQKNLKRLNEDVIDYDLLEDLICFIDDTCGEGAILVFLPVVIATNIAETSITIDDVIYVIDCGKHKESRYNPQKKLSSMVEDWISQANARQRRGRAGRVKPGICFCLYTRHRFEKLMRPYQVPEMLRMPLVELCLQIKLLSLGYIKPFLSGAIDPPKVEAMSSAISLLYEVGALEGDEMLTPLGHHLAKLPVDVLIGKMMLYGAIFGCLSPILSVSAFLSYKSPFVYPKDERQNVERAKLTLLNDKLDGPGDANDIDRQSDHLLMMTAYKRWERILTEKGAKAAQQFCNSFFLSSSVMFMIREMRVQFGTLLADIGLITLSKDYQMDRKQIGNLDSWLSDASQPFNKYAHHSSILKAILCAGLYPNVAAGEQGIVAAALSGLHRSSNSGNTGRTVWFDGRREVHIHPSSINSNSKAFQHPFLVFLEKVETNKVFLRDTSVISPYSILLFGGSINVQHQSGLITIDGWLKLTAPAQIAVLFKELRLTLHSILKELIRKPENAMVMNNEIIKSIIALLLEEGHLPK